MDRRDELEQQIWEFVYDLLPEDEAATVRRRIAAEPDAARLHDDVRRQAALLAQAARLELPPIPLQRPAAKDSAFAADEAPRPASIVAKGAAGSARRWANWAVGLAASALLCYLGVAGYQTGWLRREVAGRSPEDLLASQPVRAIVIGPQQLQPTLTNFVTVQTRNAAGAPVAAKVDYRWYDDDGTSVDSGQCQTYAGGFAQLAIAKPLRSQRVHLEVGPQTALKNVTLRCSIPVAASELTTYLTTDKTIYRPGQQVRYRTVTLDRADLQVHREVPVTLRIVNVDGREVAGLGGEVLTKKGVGFGEFELPRFQPPGTLTLIAASPRGDFPEVRREFKVRPYQTPTLRQTLDFVRDSYGPGDAVEADLRVELADGKPAANVPLAVTVEAGDRKLLNLHTTTNDQGAYRVRFNLPADSDPSGAVLNVVAGKEVQDQISERIPVHQGRVMVEFFPESGDLVPDVFNRVYFFAHDALDQPVHIRGRVVDREGRQVAEVQTIRDGRGVFGLRPARDERYRLLVEQPSDVKEQPELPRADEKQFVAIDAGPGVFGAGLPLKVGLRTQQDRTVTVVAVCRGLVVGQELVLPSMFRDDSHFGAAEILMPVAEAAEGVIRLTAYDYSAQPPTPVAERLVYRRPARRLAIQSAPPKPGYAPGDSVSLAVSVRDERGRPQSAVLGASVVDETALSLVRDRSASLTTHFWLMGHLDDVRSLEDANFYLSEGSEAEQALDLLLGTQGWRRFTTVPAEQLAQTLTADRLGQERFADQLPAAAVAEPTAPTVLADNFAEASHLVSSGLASLQSAYAQTVQRAGRVLIVGSSLLVIVLALLAAMRHLPVTTVWVPALGSSAICLVLGCVWLVASGQPARGPAMVALEDSVAGRKVAQAGVEAAPTSMPEPVATPDSAEVEGKELAEGRSLAENLKRKDGKKAGEALQAGRELKFGYGAAVPTDDLAPAKLAEKAKKVQVTDADKYEMQLEQRQTLSSEAPSRPQALKRRSAQDKYDVPPQDAMGQLGIVGKPENASGVPSRELGRVQGAVAGPAAGQAVKPQKPRTELRTAPAPAAAAPPLAGDVPMAAPAPAQAMPATEIPAASQPSVAAEGAYPASPKRGAAPEKALEKAGQPGDDAAAQQAAGMMPGFAAQGAPGAPPGMGLGGGSGMPGGYVTPQAAGGRQGQVQLRMRGQADAAAPGPGAEEVAQPAQDELSPGQQAFGTARMAEVAPERRAEVGGAASTGQPASRPEPSGSAAIRSKRGVLTPKPTPAAAEEQAVEQERVQLADHPVQPPAAPLAVQAVPPASQSLTASLERSQVRWYREYARRSRAAAATDSLAPHVETLLWEPLLETDAQGHAALQFNLPDAATTYRVLVDGHAAGRIGSCLGRIVVQPNAAAPSK